MGSCFSKGDEESSTTPKPIAAASGTTASKVVAAEPEPSQQVVAKVDPVAGKEVSETSDEKEFKILLLGSGESGKSTILKQMKILHQNGYTKKELVEYVPFVYRNVLDCSKAIAKCYLENEYPISDSVELLEGADVKKEDEAVDEYIVDGQVTEADLKEIIAYTGSTLPENIVRIAALIWKANLTKNMLLEHKNDLYLMDSARYFFSNLNRIAATDYVASVTDVLRTRKKTSGVFETRFNMGTSNIHMVDVGGQRSERKKWIHSFDNVTIIIFCVALSEYDQTLLEEKLQNRLEESLVLFDSVVNLRWFARTSIVLFLNKIDVFAEKLAHSPLENYFPDYTGGNDLGKAAKYILWRFKQVNRSNLTIYPHVTQATDTHNIQVVFAAVQETILSNSLKDSGIITIN